jgi:hypothetical protein
MARDTNPMSEREKRELDRVGETLREEEREIEEADGDEEDEGDEPDEEQ